MHKKNNHLQPDDDEQSMRLHMEESHEVKCKTCNETFAGSKKLKNHMFMQGSDRGS